MTIARLFRRCLVASLAGGLGLLAVGVVGEAPVGAEDTATFEGRAISTPLRAAANVFDVSAVYSESRLTNADGAAYATWFYPGAVGSAAAELEGIRPPAAAAAYPPGGDAAISFASPPGSPTPPGDRDPGRADAHAGEESARSTVTILPFDQQGVTVGGGVATTSVTRIDGAIISTARQDLTDVVIGDALRFGVVSAVAETRADGGGESTATTALQFGGGSLAGQPITVTSDGRIEPAGDGGPLVGPGRDTLVGALGGLGFRARFLAPEQSDLEGGKSVQSPGLLLESGSADSYSAIQIGRAASTARVVASGTDAADDLGSSRFEFDTGSDFAGVAGDDAAVSADGAEVEAVALPLNADSLDIPVEFTVGNSSTVEAGLGSGATVAPAEATGGLNEAAVPVETAAPPTLVGRRVAVVDHRIATTMQTLAKVLLGIAVATLAWPRLIRALVRS